VVIACSSKRDELPRDLAAASNRIKTAATTCAGFARSLDQLSHSTFHGRTLIGLVDDALAVAPTACKLGDGVAHQLARARRVDARPDEALASLTATSEPAIHIRRAELLDRLGRVDEALHELDATDEAATRRLYAVSVAARGIRFDEAARIIADAPLTERPSLAFRAAADAPLDKLDALALGPELATTVADRLETERGPAAALASRERAVREAPDRAEAHDALARAQIAAGKIDDALASWDRAAAIAPAQSDYRITPIRALVIAGEPQRARARATALAAQARARPNDIELLVAASAGAAAAGDAELSSALARAAHDARPGDGRLVFLLAEREGEAGRATSAAELYVELLVCGAHGRPWHRHEVSAKLVALDHAAVLAALDKPRTCEPVDAADPATYVDAIRKR
jgi:cytochrome c-type biogenesis protein CcmH/NrfG